MPAPLDAITVIHNAFRRDMPEIDEAAYKVAKHGGDLSPVLDRLQFHSQILISHAEGEEEAVFPAIDKVAPLVAKAYAIDHDELDMMTDEAHPKAGIRSAAGRKSRAMHSIRP